MKRDSKLVYQFLKMEANAGKFKVVDLHGNEEVLDLPHAELKLFRSTDKSTPVKLDDLLVKKLQMDVAGCWLVELEKAQLQTAVLATYVEKLFCILFCLIFWWNDSEIILVCRVCVSQERGAGYFLAGLHQ